jgi:hypothetical protein
VPGGASVRSSFLLARHALCDNGAGVISGPPNAQGTSTTCHHQLSNTSITVHVQNNASEPGIQLPVSANPQCLKLFGAVLGSVFVLLCCIRSEIGGLYQNVK